MGTDSPHSLERIFLRLSESSPLPTGWACLRDSHDDRDLLFAHVVVNEEARVHCDRTIVLTPLMTDKSPCLVQVTFTEFSSSSASLDDSTTTSSKSTSLLIRDLTDVSNLLNTSSSPKKVAKKSTGGGVHNGDEGKELAIRKRESNFDELDEVENSPRKIVKSEDEEMGIDAVSSLTPVTLDPVTMSLSPAVRPTGSPYPAGGASSSSSASSSSFRPNLFKNSANYVPQPKPPGPVSNPFRPAVDKERPYKCPECDKTFVRGNHLKDHVRLHRGETYECPVCNYECILQTKFTHHLTSHNNQGPFPCSTCGKTFERAHDLARHLPVDHKMDTGFRLSHFKNSFSPAQFKDKSSQPPMPSLSIMSGSGGRPSFPSMARPFPAIPSTVSSRPVTMPDFGDGSFQDMQRLMRLYGGADQQQQQQQQQRQQRQQRQQQQQQQYRGDDDDSVIPIDDDDEEEYAKVKSLDDEFGDDAILIE